MTTPTKNTGTLRDWLNDLRQRGCHITITDNVVQVRGTASRDTDRHHVNRHRHALTIAANGTHPTWWNHVLGHTDRIHLTDMPTVDDPHDRHGGYGFPCATCGQPATHLDHQLLPWCDDHQ